MKRVLVISPHPDDESVGCGGTLSSHVATGDVVRVVFLTSGENGGHKRSPQETAKLREHEAAAAARVLGIQQIGFWREQDGNLRVTARLVERLRALLTEWKPDFLYVPHDGEMHRDHRAAARLVKRALSTASSPGPYPEVRMYEVWTPLQRMDDIVDISANVRTKREAIQAYECQCEVLRFDEAALALNRYRGEMHSWPGGDYAEIFRRMRW